MTTAIVLLSVLSLFIFSAVVFINKHFPKVKEVQEEVPNWIEHSDIKDFRKMIQKMIQDDYSWKDEPMVKLKNEHLGTLNFFAENNMTFNGSSEWKGEKLRGIKTYDETNNKYHHLDVPIDGYRQISIRIEDEQMNQFISDFKDTNKLGLPWTSTMEEFQTMIFSGCAAILAGVDKDIFYKLNDSVLDTQINMSEAIQKILSDCMYHEHGIPHIIGAGPLHKYVNQSKEELPFSFYYDQEAIVANSVVLAVSPSSFGLISVSGSSAESFYEEYGVVDLGSITMPFPTKNINRPFVPFMFDLKLKQRGNVDPDYYGKSKYSHGWTLIISMRFGLSVFPFDHKRVLKYKITNDYCTTKSENPTT